MVCKMRQWEYISIVPSNRKHNIPSIIGCYFFLSYLCCLCMEHNEDLNWSRICYMRLCGVMIYTHHGTLLSSKQELFQNKNEAKNDVLEEHNMCNAMCLPLALAHIFIKWKWPTASRVYTSLKLILSRSIYLALSISLYQSPAWECLVADGGACKCKPFSRMRSQKEGLPPSYTIEQNEWATHIAHDNTDSIWIWYRSSSIEQSNDQTKNKKKKPEH